MRLAIMQPYLFPYLGYFQLINSVEKFVIYDDVQYRKGGWINRNRILINGKPCLFTFGLKKDKITKNINERFFAENFEKEKGDFLKCLRLSYSKAPYFNEIFALINSILYIKEDNLSSKLTLSLKSISKYLGIKTTFIISSKIKKDNSLKGSKKILEINKILGSNHYINLPGGVSLYKSDEFDKEGIKLSFLKPRLSKYKQFNNEFVSSLSIIDVLMFNSKKQLKNMLNDGEVI